jgi:hypothetical protein
MREPQDINSIYTDEINRTPFVWATLMGSRRGSFFDGKNLLVKKALKKLLTKKIAQSCQGIVRGDRKV